MSNLTPGEEISQASLHTDLKIYSTHMTTRGLPCSVLTYWQILEEMKAGGDEAMKDSCTKTRVTEKLNNAGSVAYDFLV